MRFLQAETARQNFSGHGRVALVGAGLVGSLLAAYLARHGFEVDIFERRPDMRIEKISAGRSINLAISTRGINALKKIGMDKRVLAQAVPMRGRMMHSVDNNLIFQPYGMSDEECINSISRATLNKILMNLAEDTGKVRIFFKHNVTGMNLPDNLLLLKGPDGQELSLGGYETVIGTDGSASALREVLVDTGKTSCSESELESGYKELLILSDRAGGFKMEANALHIWPRHNFMLIALPNFEGSYTCTLFLPMKGPQAFEHLTDEVAVRNFFTAYFPDVTPLLHDLEKTFFENPTGKMVTIKTDVWHHEGKLFVLGDAAHAIVPFYGQGMNCGFEDCVIFDNLLAQALSKDGRVDWARLFAQVNLARKANCDAIADMAVGNFIEMRDKVADRKFLLQKAVEKVLQREFPTRYFSCYALVTFSLMPYTLAQEAGRVQEELLAQLCEGLEDPEKVDLVQAENLIAKYMDPLLAKHRKELEQAFPQAISS